MCKICGGARRRNQYVHAQIFMGRHIWQAGRGRGGSSSVRSVASTNRIVHVVFYRSREAENETRKVGKVRKRQKVVLRASDVCLHSSTVPALTILAFAAVCC